MHEVSVLDEAPDTPASDTIVLTIPRDDAFRGVASLVLGGVGSRCEIPYERMDDLQLAVLSLIDASASDAITIEIRASEERIEVAVGPLRPGSETDAGLALVLGKLTDEVESGHRAGEPWTTVAIDRPDSSPPSS